MAHADRRRSVVSTPSFETTVRRWRCFYDVARVSPPRESGAFKCQTGEAMSLSTDASSFLSL